MAFNCEVLADSLNSVTGDRVTTMLVTYPLIVHAEFIRHRAFSYSVASNRAIPTNRLLDKVLSDPFVPERFPKAGKGMSPEGWLEADPIVTRAWLDARDSAVNAAERLASFGVHKQIANRVLMPWQWVTQLTTGDQYAYKNFFAQRCHPAAQAEIQKIAGMMNLRWCESNTRMIAPGEWHLPFMAPEGDHPEWLDLDTPTRKKLSVARSARTSYLNHDGDYSIDDDVNLHDRLVSQVPPHYSPFEHQLLAMAHSTKYANFTGFKSYRKILEEAA